MPVLKIRLYLCSSALLLSASASAQHEMDPIAECAQISSTGDRILCLENALRERAGESQVESITERSSSTDDVVIEAQVEEEPVSTSGNVGDATTEAPPATAESTQTTEVSDVAPNREYEIGAEQVVARSMTSEERNAALARATNQRVAGYRMIPYERLVVELENGQIWRQIKGDVQRIRVNLEKNQTADITQSRLGGYQLRLNEIRRTIRVERIR